MSFFDRELSVRAAMDPGCSTPTSLKLEISQTNIRFRFLPNPLNIVLYRFVASVGQSPLIRKRRLRHASAAAAFRSKQEIHIRALIEQLRQMHQTLQDRTLDVQCGRRMVDTFRRQTWDRGTFEATASVALVLSMDIRR